MNVQEVYMNINGDYNDIMQRLGKEELVIRFSKKFLNDPSFKELKEAMQEDDMEKAFRAIHTLKGVCMNLSFISLLEVSKTLTEALRPGNEMPERDILDEMFRNVEEEYLTVIHGIEQMD